MCSYMLYSRSVRAPWIAVVLVACVPSRSAVFDPVGSDIQRRLGAGVAWRTADDDVDAATAAMLAKPLDLDAAIRVALARNRGLQASFDELGIAASQIADATVLPPTTVDLDYKRALSGAGDETEVVVVQDLLALAQVGQRRGIAGAELRAAQARAVAATVELARRVELAFYALVAARQDLVLVRAASDAAAAAAAVVERQHAAGNASDLDLVREQEMRGRMLVAVSEAEQQVEERTAALGGLLGIDRSTPWATIDRLPELPAEAPEVSDLEAAAADASLEIAALRADADGADRRHGYAMVRSVLPELGAGVALSRREQGSWEVGPAIRIGIPLFDQQQGPRARARAEKQRARHAAAATRMEIRAEAEGTRARVEHAFAEAHQLGDTVLPLRRRVLEETLLQYNAMNASTFELLTARRDMVEVERQYVDALRRYWSALAEARALRRGGHATGATEEQP